jgi:hypothetical protein
MAKTYIKRHGNKTRTEIMTKEQLHFWYSEEQAKSHLDKNKEITRCIIDSVEYEYTKAFSNKVSVLQFKDAVYLGIGHIHSVNGVVQK